MKTGRLIGAAALAGAFAAAAWAQQPGTGLQAGAETSAYSIPVARDAAWPGGVMTLDIDASDVSRGVYRATQTIPLAPGTRRITLLLPEWLPGHHAPKGPIAELADLNFTVGGKPVSWRRDLFDVYAFHIELPEGARELVARFVHTSPLKSSQGRVTMTPEMLNLQWEKMSLYPAGHYVSRIRIRPTVTFPEGWTAATALKGMAQQGNRVSWAETDYETLVDSPIFAGAHFRKWNLGHDVELEAVADEPSQLALSAENLQRLSALIDEALLTFGKPPFDRYDFLVALSERLGGIGLEHLKSSENQLEPQDFAQWQQYDWDRNVLSHELAHAWNGKYRRPARLWTPDYRTPMQDDLLWVYEGQTQFWGWVLAARSGLQGKDTVLGIMAEAAGYYSEQPGRDWRSIADTTLDPIAAKRKPRPYSSLTRSEDYYREGALIWLEADQIIRRGTKGRKGLDDFAQGFFSYPGDGSRVRTYEFGDIVAGLRQVYDYDWESFLRSRIDESGRPPPLKGVEMAGYDLVWKEEPNPYAKARMDHSHYLDLYFSLGLTVENDGAVSGARWDSPAFKAGIVTGANIVAVNGWAFSGTRLSQAITQARDEKKPIELLVRRADRYQTIPVPYYGGLRWPWLEPASRGGKAGLDQLLAPRRRGASQ